MQNGSLLKAPKKESDIDTDLRHAILDKPNDKPIAHDAQIKFHDVSTFKKINK